MFSVLGIQLCHVAQKQPLYVNGCLWLCSSKTIYKNRPRARFVTPAVVSNRWLGVLVLLSFSPRVLKLGRLLVRISQVLFFYSSVTSIVKMPGIGQEKIHKEIKEDSW